MPPNIQGDRQYRSSFRPERTFDYDYPEGLDLKPGSELHNRIRDDIMQRSYDSARVMSGRHSAWNDIDHTLTAYIPVDEKEALVKDKDARRPVSIVFPYTYTILETLLSYYVAAFLQDPIFRYEGVGPNDVIGAILLEKLIALQCIKNKVGLNLHTQARDAFAYGFGVVTPIWTQDYGRKTTTQRADGFAGMFGKSTTTTLDNQLLFEGNALENIDPYLYLPDVTVPIHDPQKGDYSGWMNTTSYMQLLGEERNSEVLFNVQYLDSLKGKTSSVFPSDSSGRNTKSGVNVSNSYQSLSNNTINIVKMFTRIIPNELGVGDSKYPELWYFEIAQDEIVIQARPANLDHNKFPVSVIAPDFDGYSTSPISRVEILYGMQGVLDFMFNSHVANVRKAINDMLIYDPYLVNSNDLKNPEPGKLIRMRRPAWGKGVKDAVQQLQINDVTRGNVADSAFLVQWMDRVSGADSAIQGSLRQGGPERLTGQEFQGTMAGSINRLERIAKVVGMQGMQDVGTFFGIHNRQMMSAEGYIKLTGEWQEVLMQEFGKNIDRGRIPINPTDVDIHFNAIVRDGSVPGGNYSDAWIKLYGILAKNPELAQKFDVVRIFTHIARNLGAKNVNDFVRRGGGINPVQASDETVRQQAQAGNIVPIGEAA